MQRIKLIKITCIINKNLSDIVLKTIRDYGVKYIHHQAGSSIILVENTGVKRLYHETSFEGTPVDIFDFYTNTDSEISLIQAVVEDAKLYLPGRGSITSHKVELVSEAPFKANYRVEDTEADGNRIIRKNLTGIYCIVQRGKSNPLVQAILDLGIAVPVVTYGYGTGLRDKLGLLRITIPAEKDIIRLVVDTHEAENIMKMLISVGKLDEPGKGFIFMYPIRYGLLDTKFFSGNTRHAASIEQIISVIDNMRGNADWRKHDATHHKERERKIKYLEKLAGLTFVSNEGFSKDLVNKSMNAGAAGATISKLSYVNDKGGTDTNISIAREMSDLIIPQNLVEKIVQIMSDSEVLSESQSIIEISEVAKACTYLGNKK